MQVLSPPAAPPGGRAWLAQVPLLSAESQPGPSDASTREGRL
jgi:hypothetical protein